jgi:hypothetical protein
MTRTKQLQFHKPFSIYVCLMALTIAEAVTDGWPARQAEDVFYPKGAEAGYECRPNGCLVGGSVRTLKNIFKSTCSKMSLLICRKI